MVEYMESLRMQLVSILAGLEVHVVQLTCRVTEHLSKKLLGETVKEYVLFQYLYALELTIGQTTTRSTVPCGRRFCDRGEHWRRMVVVVCYRRGGGTADFGSAVPEADTVPFEGIPRNSRHNEGVWCHMWHQSPGTKFDTGYLWVAG